MPVTGRKPKPEGQSVTRHKQTHDWIEVENVPFEGDRPELPESRRVVLPFGNIAEIPMHDLTKRWWQVVSAMPHCKLWTDSDWQFAIATSLVADAFFYGHGPSATELARREKVLGTTVDYRRDLRIRYVEATDADVRPLRIASRADDLASVVD